jgi:glycerol-3-phosphate dehydrogenase
MHTPPAHPELVPRSPISRHEAWDRLGTRRFDLLVIGAGIIGARIALEASRAGLSVALVDAGDFGGATSSASSKLIHGGFRYLPMGDLQLVWESQHERRALMGRVAPHLVRPLPMVLAAYRGGPRGPLTSAAGVLAYAALCGFRGTGVGLVGAGAARRFVPPLRTEGLSVCGLFGEGQTNDARLVLDTVAAAAGLGATVLNHARVVALDHPHGRLATASIEGRNGEGVVEMGFRFVINASGPWVDPVRRLEDQACPPMARLSKGIHVLLETSSEWRAGVVVPLEDGRVAMALPWQGMLMLGTTDTDYEGDPADCSVSAPEVNQVLWEASLALPPDVVRGDAVRFSFAGLRVLPLGTDTTVTAHREHLVQTGRFGMVSIAGGKLTTHRRIALEALHRLPDPRLASLSLVDVPLPQSSTALQEQAELDTDPDVVTHLTRIYGRDWLTVMGQRSRHRDAFERIHPGGPDVWAQVYHAVEREWATTVEDVLRRRTTVAVRGLGSPAVRAEVGRVLATTARSCEREPGPRPGLRLVRPPAPLL